MGQFPAPKPQVKARPFDLTPLPRMFIWADVPSFLWHYRPSGQHPMSPCRALRDGSRALGSKCPQLPAHLATSSPLDLLLLILLRPPLPQRWLEQDWEQEGISGRRAQPEKRQGAAVESGEGTWFCLCPTSLWFLG